MIDEELYKYIKSKPEFTPQKPNRDEELDAAFMANLLKSGSKLGSVMGEETTANTGYWDTKGKIANEDQKIAMGENDAMRKIILDDAVRQLKAQGESASEGKKNTHDLEKMREGKKLDFTNASKLEGIKHTNALGLEGAKAQNKPLGSKLDPASKASIDSLARRTADSESRAIKLGSVSSEFAKGLTDIETGKANPNTGVAIQFAMTEALPVLNAAAKENVVGEGEVNRLATFLKGNNFDIHFLSSSSVRPQLKEFYELMRKAQNSSLSSVSEHKKRIKDLETGGFHTNNIQSIPTFEDATKQQSAMKPPPPYEDLTTEEYSQLMKLGKTNGLK